MTNQNSLDRLCAVWLLMHHIEEQTFLAPVRTSPTLNSHCDSVQVQIAAFMCEHLRCHFSL